jgi:fructokinase
VSLGAETQARVTVIGEALVDLVQNGTGAQFTAHPGGSPFNVAVGLARLDVQTSLMARFANNAFGVLLRARAQAEGIDLSASPTASEPTTLAVVTIDDQALASYDFYTEGTADWQWTAAEADRLPDRTAILHHGSIASWTPPGHDHIANLARRLHDAGDVLVSYDPNIRPSLLNGPAHTREMIERSVRSAHLAKASSDDLTWLYPRSSIESIAERWLALGPDIVIVTDGPSGARGFADTGPSLQRPGIEVPVADTVGAGDSFTAALLASLIERGVHSPATLQSLPPTARAASIDDAIRASALTCQRAGADPPTTTEIRTPSAPRQDSFVRRSG